MAYSRFLNDNDYMAIITPENFGQLVRNFPERVVQAEQSAEMDVREYLDQFYEVERELCMGKSIRVYSPMVSYPPQARFYVDGKPARSLTAINGYRKPSAVKYWTELYSIPPEVCVEKIPEYRQMFTYHKDSLVRYGSVIWRCLADNGWDFLNIAIPGQSAWGEVYAPEWEKMVEYEKDEVRSYQGVYYTLVTKEGYDPSVSPLESDCWGEIGQYSTDYEYEFGDEKSDYAVFEGTVFLPLANPNADRLKENVNFVYDDVRNPNLVKHMTRIALYYLHQTVSPTNIPQSRQYMYEESKDWLYKASKLKLNPQIPRKRTEKGEPKDDWVISDFTTSYADVAMNNPWLL